jgi:alanine racemase
MMATKFRIGPFKQIFIGHPPLRALVAWRREIFLFDEAVEAVTEKETQHVIENPLATVEKTRRITALAQHARQRGEVLPGLLPFDHSFTRQGVEKSKPRRLATRAAISWLLQLRPDSSSLRAPHFKSANMNCKYRLLNSDL